MSDELLVWLFTGTTLAPEQSTHCHRDHEPPDFVDQMNKCCCKAVWIARSCTALMSADVSGQQLTRQPCLLLSFSPGGPVGFVSADSGAAGVGGNAAENHSDCSSDLKVTRTVWHCHHSSTINRVISCHQTRVKYGSALKGQVHLNFRKEKLRIMF